MAYLVGTLQQNEVPRPAFVDQTRHDASIDGPPRLQTLSSPRQDIQAQALAFLSSQEERAITRSSTLLGVIEPPFSCEIVDGIEETRSYDPAIGTLGHNLPPGRR